MKKCYHCHKEIEFRYVDGRPIPIHIHGGYCTGTTSTGYSYGKSMRERAMELGHSLIFPTNCRHCALDIYLFADENGGFRIFEVVGDPWTQHNCVGWTSSDDYHVPYGKPLSNKYKLPVPRDATTVDLKDCAFLRGTVVLVRQSRCIIFSTGQKLADVIPSTPVRIGQFVQGQLRKDSTEFYFDLNICSMPNEASSETVVSLVANKDAGTIRKIARLMTSNVGPIARWCIVDEKLVDIEDECFPHNQKQEAEERLAELRLKTGRILSLLKRKD